MIHIKNLSIEYPLENNRKYKALNNISIKFEDYDHVAIIGGNGSGKSTLLRAIAGIYHPSHGSVTLSGEPLTTFNVVLGMEPEESGINNVIIKGLYYGLTEQEIYNGIDKIKSFSELGDFFYRPIRSYSNGMKARLAFSILTIINREIYLVDEGIGVGDKLFKEKARAIIKSKSRNCKNFIFASHSDQLVKEFCNKALWLDKGKIRMYGGINKVLSSYNK